MNSTRVIQALAVTIAGVILAGYVMKIGRGSSEFLETASDGFDT